MSGRRICLVGDMSGNIDEGMKKVTYNIYKELSKNNEVIVVKPLELIRGKTKINEFNPDIIHYITGPSIFSFFLLKIGAFGLKDVKTVLSVSHPQKLFPKFFISILRPNMAIVQSDDMNKFFSNLGINTIKICNGIDLKSFCPVDSRQKLYLRSKYGIADDKFVILHVGNIRAGRNLYPLTELANTSEFQVVVVASTTIKKDIKLYNDLVASNVLVIDYYVENIAEIYNLSDIYLFTVRKRPFAIEVPLSVMEALACNIPVITFPFAGLNSFFCKRDGLYFANSDDEMVQIANELYNSYKQNNLNSTPRGIVSGYSWGIVAAQIQSIYDSLVERSE